MLYYSHPLVTPITIVRRLSWLKSLKALNNAPRLWPNTFPELPIHSLLKFSSEWSLLDNSKPESKSALSLPHISPESTLIKASLSKYSQPCYRELITTVINKMTSSNERMINFDYSIDLLFLYEINQYHLKQFGICKAIKIIFIYFQSSKVFQNNISWL